MNEIEFNNPSYPKWLKENALLRPVEPPRSIVDAAMQVAIWIEENTPPGTVVTIAGLTALGNKHMDMNHLAIDIKAWADQAFPGRTDASMFLKLYGETAEMIDAGDDCEDEVADVLILVLDYARRKGINPSTAVQRKLAINRQREWRQTPLGVFQHVPRSE